MNVSVKTILSGAMLAGLLILTAGVCRAEDLAALQLKVQNSDLEIINGQLKQQYKDVVSDRQAIKRKLDAAVKENARLKDRMASLAQKLEDQRKVPDSRRVNDKLKDSALALVKTEKKNEKLIDEAADAHYNLGVVFQEQNRNDEAIKEFEAVLKENPDDADAHYNVALIYDKVKNNRKLAMDHYSAYLRLDPEAEDVLPVKERLAELQMKDKVWGDPNVTGISPRETLNRL